MTDKLPWFRMYGEAVDDEKLRLLAFEDRWHFVALLCCKTQGILDEGSAIMHRKVAVKLGVDMRTLEEIVRRLAEVELIDEKTLQPIAWENRQFKSDSSKERTQKYRERMKRHSDGVVTVQDTDTDTDTDTETEKHNTQLPVENSAKPRTRSSADKPVDVSEEVWQSFKLVRNKKKAAITDLAILGIRREAVKAGITLEDAMTICCERGWASFKADWDWRGGSKPSSGRPNANAALFASMTHLHQQPQQQPEEHNGRTIDATPLLG